MLFELGMLKAVIFHQYCDLNLAFRMSSFLINDVIEPCSLKHAFSSYSKSHQTFYAVNNEKGETKQQQKLHFFALIHDFLKPTNSQCEKRN